MVKGRLAKVANLTITEQLAAEGVPPQEISQLIATIEIGFKKGTLSVVTGGLSDAEVEFGKDSFFDAAYAMGKSAMRWASPGWIIFRFILPVIIILAVVVYGFFK